jgi:hypothetical protein
MAFRVEKKEKLQYYFYSDAKAIEAHDSFVPLCCGEKTKLVTQIRSFRIFTSSQRGGPATPIYT